MDTELNPVN